MDDRVLKCISDYGMLSPGDKVVCAVSGGADSMAMLLCLFSLRTRLGITLEAAHYNHMLRGTEADRDEQYVRAFCREKNIPFHCGAGDVAAFAKEQGLSIEDAARQMRYRYLEGLDGKIATAHTADDQAETLVMRLLRGSGTDGLCGIAPVRGRIIRPMLYVTHEEAEAYLQANGIVWQEDSTNRADDCLRNRIRHHVMPLLKAENPAFPRLSVQTGNLARLDCGFLNAQAAELLQNAETPFGYSCEILAAAPQALLGRALRLLLPCDYAHITALTGIIQSGNGELSLPDGLRAVCSCGTLMLPEGEPADLPETVLIPGTDTEISGLFVSCRIIPAAPHRFDNSKVHLRLPSSEEVITLRSRKSGDKLKLRSGSVSLKELMIDRKIPEPMRRRIPIICYNGIPAAAAGLRTGADYFAAPGEPAIQITVTSSHARLTK